MRSRREPPPLPKRPYRDSLVVFLVLGVVIVVMAWATGGDLGRAFVIAAAFVVLATGWSWWRYHRRLAREAGR